MTDSPLALSEDDFDALEVSGDLQRRLQTFARGTVLRMRAEGFDASVEMRPSGVRFVRDGAPANALELALLLDGDGIEVALRVPSADRLARDWRNLRECSRRAEPSLQLTTLIEALPEPFSMGAAGDVSHIAPPVTSDQLRNVLLIAEASGVPFWVGWRVSRAVVRQYTGNIDEELEDALLALVPLARFIVWDDNNDYLSKDPGRGRQVFLTAAERDPPSRTTRRAKPGSRARLRPRARTPEPEDEQVEPSTPLFAPPSVRPPPPVLPSAALRFLRRAALVTEVDPTIPVEKGTRVRVLAGPFVGKVGVVQELDGRGRARVLLGLLSTTCSVKDLIAARERDRRPLMSSHRRLR
jgi:hypothetical protein